MNNIKGVWQLLPLWRDYRLNAVQILLLVLIPMSGCKKFVEIDPPSDKLVTSTVFDKDETAIAALTQIYSRMINDQILPYNLPLYTGLSADEFNNHSTSITILSFYLNNQLSNTETASKAFWLDAYKQIYQANSVFEGCNQSSKLKPEVKKQLMAEALFIRAWWHFYLVNLFGDVPIVTTTDYTINSKLSRSPIAKVYDQIISDLKTAEAQLNAQYVTGDGSFPSETRVRPNSFAATALLSRTYLYAGKNDLAEAAASKIIAKTELYGLEDLENTFLITSKEAIWQIMTPPQVSSTSNSMEGNNFILTSKPSPYSTSNIVTISGTLLQTFEGGDQRKEKWIGTFQDQTVLPYVDYPYPFKFKIKSSKTPSEYTTPLRLAEQYLIRSEARAKQGNIGGAKTDLNLVRHRSGLEDTQANDKTTMLNAILHERQVEFFAEWGHRWMDLKRYGIIDQVMQATAPLKGGTWKSYQQLWPIPQGEIDNDANLKQNPGYN